MAKYIDVIMKILVHILMLFSLFMLYSCAHVAELEHDGTYEIVITASSEVRNSDTKTLLQSNGAVYWTPGDALSLFFNAGTDGGSKFLSLCNQVEAVSSFKGTVTNVSGGGEDFVGVGTFWGVYPYSEENSCDGSSVTIPVRQYQTGLEENFSSGTFPTVARSESLELAFFNVCGGVKFSVQNEGIKSVRFKANGGETIAGKVRVVFDENRRPAVTEVLEGVDEIILNAPDEGTFKVGAHYYIVALPAELKNGYTMTFYKSDQTEADVVQDASVAVKRSIFGVLENVDESVSEWNASSDADAPGASGELESGLYIGVVGFNQELYKMPIRRLTYNSHPIFNEFIDGLTTKNGTLLYYAADNAISALSSTSYPDDLFSVAMVTFTDGLDQGSLMMNWDYETDEEYLSAINSRFYSMKVSELPITAYSIGVRGEDVADIKSFQNNLAKLATSSDNVAEVTSMSEIEAKFEEIADELSKTINEQTVSLNVPGKATGTKFRFTFDDVSSASSSRMYIEGVLDRRAGTLSELKYEGLTSSSGETVTGTLNGIFYNFTFEGIRTDDGEVISENFIQQWTYETTSSIWQINSEFDQAEDSEIINEKKSAAIILVLDCSKSLGDDITLVKEAAKSFIDKLYRASSDPLAVAAVSLNKSVLNLDVGQSEVLKASIMPTTAADKSVKWSSNNADVATVDVNGRVIGRANGESMIYATSLSCGKTATCRVSVIQKAQSISLNTEALNLHVGETYKLVASVLPKEMEQGVEWTSSDASVAAVNQDGEVSALKPGKAEIYAVTMDETALKAVCFLSVIEEGGMPEMLSLWETYPDGFKMQITMPSSVKVSIGGVDGGRAIRYRHLDLMLYNAYGLNDYERLLYNEGKFLREDTVLEYSNRTNWGKVQYDANGDGVVDDNDHGALWNWIVPGEPIVYLAGEFEWMQEPWYYLHGEERDAAIRKYLLESNTPDLNYGDYVVNGFYYPAGRGPGYYLPCIDSTRFWNIVGSSSATKSTGEITDLDLSSPIDVAWTGAFERKVFRTRVPDVLDANIKVEIEDLRSVDATVRIVPDENIYRYIFTILDDSSYKHMLKLLDEHEEYVQWAVTSYFASVMFGSMGVVAGNGETSAPIAEIVLSEYFLSVPSQTKFHVLVTGMSGEIGSPQCFHHSTFSTPAKMKTTGPEIEVTALPDKATPYAAAFNVKCVSTSSNPCVRCYYGAAYYEEWVADVNSGWTYEMGGTTNLFTEDELQQINSAEGYDMYIPSIDGKTTRLVVIGFNDENVSNDIDSYEDVLSHPAVDDCTTPYAEAEDIRYNPLLDNGLLDGEWTLTATVVNNGIPQVQKSKVSIKNALVEGVDYPKNLPDSVVALYKDLTKWTEEEIFGLYDEFKYQVGVYNEKRLRNQNKLLLEGWMDNDSEGRLSLITPWDMFISRTISTVNVDQMFTDFGPKMYITVNKDNQGKDLLSITADKYFASPVANWSIPFYMAGYANHETNNTIFYFGNAAGEFQAPLEFAVEMSDDKNTLTIKGFEHNGAVYYPNVIGVDPKSSPGYVFDKPIISDVVLTRGWTGSGTGGQAAVPATRSASWGRSAYPVTPTFKPNLIKYSKDHTSKKSSQSESRR